ncbi:MAG: aminotransferase class IV [Clostridiaceae bacterium]
MEWIKDYKEKKVITDAGIFFGKGIFETIPVFKEPVMLSEHIGRLNNALKTFSINKGVDLQEITDIIKEDNIEYKSLKITVTPENRVISLRDLPYREEHYQKGYSLGISKVIKNSTSILAGIKSTCYWENILIREAGAKHGFDEMIQFNEKGHLAEGTCSNIFFVKDGVVYTPEISCGLLNGVMRKWIVSNFQVREGCFSEGDLLSADEVFITNSLMGIMWVNKIQSKKYVKGAETDDIIEKYNLFLGTYGGKIHG